MPKELTQEEYWKLFQKLPDEIKTLILAEETAKDIFDICDRNDVDIERVSQVADYTGRVLLGVLPPKKFRETLEKELGLEKEQAKKVAQEIHRSIFLPVRGSLEALYRMEVVPPAKPKVAPPIKPVKPVKPGVTPPPAPPEEKPELPPKKPDIYREPIE